MSRRRGILTKYNAKKLQWLHGALLFIGLAILLAAVMQIWIGVSRVSGASMESTYHNGSIVLYNRRENNIDYGDVVAIKMASGERYIKRVVGLPGDVIDLQEGTLYVNGIPENRSCANGTTHPQSAAIEYPCTVEEGRYFVLGDNREASVDSRTFGTLSRSQIRGVVLGSK